jgi:hypothetical protein
MMLSVHHVRGLRVVHGRKLILPIAGGVLLQLALIFSALAFVLTLHEAEPALHRYGQSEWANPKAKIDPKTGNGTPWTIVWDKRGNYDYTRKDGNRKHSDAAALDRSKYSSVPDSDFLRITGLYGSYSEAAVAMVDEQRDEAGRWSAAPLPTAQPLAHNSPSPSPAQWSTTLAAAPLSWSSTVTRGTVIMSSSSGNVTSATTPKPFATPIRIYERDQAENWMTVLQLDQNADKSWAHDNVKIETRAKPFVRSNKLTGGWTIEFVDKANPEARKPEGQK